MIFGLVCLPKIMTTRYQTKNAVEFKWWNRFPIFARTASAKYFGNTFHENKLSCAHVFSMFWKSKLRNQSVHCIVFHHNSSTNFRYIINWFCVRKSNVGMLGRLKNCRFRSYLYIIGLKYHFFEHLSTECKKTKPTISSEHCQYQS